MENPALGGASGCHAGERDDRNSTAKHCNLQAAGNATTAALIDNGDGGCA